jgi:hypothetical protein
MDDSKEALYQAIIRQNYSTLSATIKAGCELEGVLEHLQKDEFKPEDIREISSSFNDVIKAVNQIRSILTVKNKQ